MAKDEYFGALIEMVSFERLCELYLEQTNQSAAQKVKLREFIKKVQTEHDQIIRDTGGTLLG